MAELYWCCSVFLISLLGRMTSGSDDIAKSVCRGDSVQLFNKIQVNSSQTILSLYKNGDKEKIIASWNIERDTINQSNIVLDGYKNLWIINAHPSDEGKYILQNSTGNHKSSSEIQLSVLIAPERTCKPTIKKVDNVLKASLDTGEDCGKPPVSVYWLEYIGVKHEESKDLAELQPGREAGTYYACIEGPAVSCTKSTYPSLNHCSIYQIETSSTQSGTGDRNDVIWITLTILVLQTVVIVNLLYTKLKTRMRSKCAVNERNQGIQEESKQILPRGCLSRTNEDETDAADTQV